MFRFFSNLQNMQNSEFKSYQKRRKISLFMDIFSRIIILEFVVLALLMIAFYYVFNITTIKILKDSHNKILSQISYSAKYMDENVKKDILSLVSNQNTVQIMYYNTITPEKEYILYSQVNDLIKSIPYIDSVYIYNENPNIVYIFGKNRGISLFEEFYDKSFLEEFKNRNMIMKPIPRRVNESSLSNANYTKVISYVFADMAETYKLQKSRVVVNVKASYINDLIQAVKTDDGKHSGIIVVNNSENEYEAIVKTGIAEYSKIYDEIIDMVVAYNKSNGLRDSIVTSLSDNKWVSSIVYLQELNWSFISVTSNDFFMKPIKEFLSVVLIICLVGTITSIGVTMLVTGLIYKPMKFLNSAISELKLNNAYRGYKQMFRDISKAIKDSQDSLNSLLQYKKTTEDYTKESIIKKILNGSIYSVDAKKSIYQNMSFDIDFNSNMRMMLIMIDNFKAFLNNYNPNEREIALFAVRNIVRSCINKTSDKKSEIISIDEGSILCIMNVALEEMENSLEKEEEYTELCKDINKLVVEEIGLSVSITISEKVESIEELNIMYERTIESSKARLKSGSNSIIFASKQESKELKFAMPENLFKELVASLKKEDIISTKLRYKDIVEYFKPFSYNFVAYGFSHLLIRIFDYIDSIEKNINDRLEIDYNAFMQRITGLETFEQYEAVFVELFDSISKNIHQWRNNDVIEFVKSYVEKNYIDSYLSHIQISEKLKLSPEYLNKIFKKHMKMSISEYIQKTRLDSAIDLLKNSSLNVNEIIEHVGWENKLYFYTVFKKYTGLTPAEFKLKNNTSL